jgi:hypothetical protein
MGRWGSETVPAHCIAALPDGSKSCGLLRRSFSVTAQIRTGGIAGIRGANEEETPVANEGGATVFDGNERDAGGGVVRPTVLSLFAGVGGFDLAFEAEGFQTIGFSEIEKYAELVFQQPIARALRSQFP